MLVLAQLVSTFASTLIADHTIFAHLTALGSFIKTFVATAHYAKLSVDLNIVATRSSSAQRNRIDTFAAVTTVLVGSARRLFDGAARCIILVGMIRTVQLPIATLVKTDAHARMEA